MEFSFMSKLSEHLEHLAFEGMMRADHADLSRDVAGVGSVS
jgi:hypothetical protein